MRAFLGFFVSAFLIALGYALCLAPEKPEHVHFERELYLGGDG